METGIQKTMVKFSNIGLVVVITLASLLVIAGTTSFYFYKKANTVVDPQAEAIKDLAKTIKLVGKHMVLPTDEEPTIATVSDPEKLKDQPFFINAKKGDKVLIYSNARKAILYNPLDDKIIEVAPINLNSNVPIGN